MFRKILVPLDGTAEAAVALAPAIALAKATQARVTLVRVVESTEDESTPTASHTLERIGDELASAGVVTDTVMRDGEPVDEIVAEIDEGGHDLVVMATHGRGGLGRALMGSVASGVVAGSRAPVMLLRPGGHKTTRIGALLVPVDGTPGGAVALGAALALARATGAAVHLLEVVTPVPIFAGYPPDIAMPVYVDPAWDEEAQKAAQGYVEGLAARLVRAGVQASGRAVLGETVPAILAAAEAADVDLIVMSTHALTGPARALLGSTADAVARSSRRPVLLIRRSAPHVERKPRAAPAAEPVAVGFDPSA
jgi:nucleotide-binding universal stress UspA family protein